MRWRRECLALAFFATASGDLLGGVAQRIETRRALAAGDRILAHRVRKRAPITSVRERAQDALLFATQDERILARTGGDYLKFYDQPEGSARDIAEAWWSKFGHFWALADSTR